MRNYGFGLRCAGVVFIFAMAPTLALAYIDPGNGAYMVQGLFALLGAALFYLRHPLRSLKEFWRWGTSRIGQAPAAEPVDAASGSDPGMQDRENASNANV